MKITILGNGAWGSALNKYFSEKGHKITIDEISDSEIILVCVPSKAVLSVLLKHKKDIKNQQIIICSKGFTSDKKLISEVISKEFDNDIFYLYGPTLAKEIKDKEFSGMVLAGGNGKEKLKKEIESEDLFIELSDDIIGVQIGAALKNVVNIFIGLIEGAGYGQNTQAYVFTKGLAEIQKIGIALGANPNTFLGLSCVGDLTLRSRNRLLGIELGKGRKLDEIIIKVNYTLEGLDSLKSIKSIAEKYEIKIPFIETLYSIIFENKNIIEGVKNLR